MTINTTMAAPETLHYRYCTLIADNAPSPPPPPPPPPPPTCALRVQEEHEAAHGGENVERVKVVVDSVQGGNGWDVVVHVVLQVLLSEKAIPFGVVEASCVSHTRHHDRHDRAGSGTAQGGGGSFIRTWLRSYLGQCNLQCYYNILCLMENHLSYISARNINTGSAIMPQRVARANIILYARWFPTYSTGKTSTLIA